MILNSLLLQEIDTTDVGGSKRDNTMPVLYNREDTVAGLRKKRKTTKVIS